MVVSCAVMLTCEASESVPVFTLQRSTPQPEVVIGSLSVSLPGMPCAQAARESANVTNAVRRFRLASSWIRMAAQSARVNHVHNEYDKVRAAPTFVQLRDF